MQQHKNPQLAREETAAARCESPPKFPWSSSLNTTGFGVYVYAARTLSTSARTLAMKWSIIVCCTCVGDWDLDDQPWFTREHNALYPSIAVLLVSYFISSAVSDLYVAMMDTILMLCIKDIKHGGQNIPPGGLRSAFNVKTNDQVDQEKAARKKAIGRAHV